MKETRRGKQKTGYLIPDGYMGWVEAEHRYRIFATEKEYLEVEHGESANTDKSESR